MEDKDERVGVHHLWPVPEVRYECCMHVTIAPRPKRKGSLWKEAEKMDVQDGSWSLTVTEDVNVLDKCYPITLTRDMWPFFQQVDCIFGFPGRDTLVFWTKHLELDNWNTPF